MIGYYDALGKWTEKQLKYCSSWKSVFSWAPGEKAFLVLFLLSVGSFAYAAATSLSLACLSCSAVDLTGSMLFTMGDAGAAALGPAIKIVFFPFAALYWVFSCAKLVNPAFTDIGPGDMGYAYTRLGKSLFLLVVVSAFAFGPNSFDLMFTYLFGFILKLGLAFSDKISEIATFAVSSDGSVVDGLPACQYSSQFTVPANYKLVLDRMLCSVEKLDNAVGFGMDVGETLMKTFNVSMTGGIDGGLQALFGIVLWVVYGALGLTLGFMFLRVVYRLGFVSTLASLYAVFYVFPKTQQMSIEALKVFVYSAWFMVSAAVYTQVSAQILNVLVTSSVNQALAESGSNIRIRSAMEAVSAIRNDVAGWSSDLPWDLLFALLATPFIMYKLLPMIGEMAQTFSGFMGGGNERLGGGGLSAMATGAGLKAGQMAGGAALKGAGKGLGAAKSGVTALASKGAGMAMGPMGVAGTTMLSALAKQMGRK